MMFKMCETTTKILCNFVTYGSKSAKSLFHLMGGIIHTLKKTCMNTFQCPIYIYLYFILWVEEVYRYNNKGYEIIIDEFVDVDIKNSQIT